MSGHTPGPWRVTKLIPLDAENNDYPGAEISWREADERRHHHSGAVQIWSNCAEADARLIAAAPDLLVAALDMYAAWTAHSITQHEVSKLKAAIDKAEGR